MDTREKYYLTETPDWAKGPTNEELIDLAKKTDKNDAIKNAGKGLCYFYKRVVNTSNAKNQNYLIRMWDINTPGFLQSASVHEFFLKTNQYLHIHRVLVIRNGVVVDKKNDLNVRVMDDERDSEYGSISNIKKVNCIIQDVRLGDVFMFESTTEYDISTDTNVLDQQYYRTIHSMPDKSWFYNQYNVTFINNRKENIRIVKKYFRDTEYNRIPDEHTVLKTNEHFVFEQPNLQIHSKETLYDSYIEIATDATWKEISDSIVSLYKESLDDMVDLKQTDNYKSLKLDETEDIDEKIQKIIEYVQNQTVYIYDAEVMHGHIPQKAAKTFELRSGDCKATSILLVHLLKSIGVTSEPILVNTEMDYHLPNYLPSPFIFNHVIVKITHQEKDYFVDPTVINKSGILGKRAERMLASYFPVHKDAILITKKLVVPSAINIEKDITITLLKDTGTIKIKALYRRESADIIRSNFQKLELSEGIESQNLNVIDNLSYTVQRKSEDVLKDVVYKMESDDKKNNEIVTSYEATLINPYEVGIRTKVLRYYYSLKINQIKDHKLGDFPCDNFCSYSLKYNLSITSDLSIDTHNPTTKKNLLIDNNYFYCSNQKTISPKEMKLASEFRHKTYDVIKNEDFETTKKDYEKVKDSNFGVGVVFYKNFLSRVLKTLKI